MHPQRRKSVFAFGRASLGYCRDKAMTCSANGGLGECANYISIPTWVAISTICARWRWYSIGQRLNWSRSPQSQMIEARERAMHGTRSHSLDEEISRFAPEQTFRRAITTLCSQVFQTKMPIGRKSSSQSQVRRLMP